MGVSVRGASSVQERDERERSRLKRKERKKTPSPTIDGSFTALISIHSNLYPNSFSPGTRGC